MPTVNFFNYFVSPHFIVADAADGAFVAAAVVVVVVDAVVAAVAGDGPPPS